MKRSAWIRLLALVLVCCIVAAPSASAAPYVRAAAVNAGTIVSADASANTSEGASASAGTAATGSFWSGLTGWFRSLFGGSDTLAADEGVNAAADTTTTLKYFPVTLLNYDTDKINNATHQAEVNAGLGSVWNGIYFNTGDPQKAESYTYTTSAGAHSDLTWAQVKSGTYYSDEACTKVVTVNEVKGPDTVSYTEATTVSCNTLISGDSSSWTACSGYYYKDGESYYPLYAQRSKSSNKYTYTWGYSKTSSASDVNTITTQETYTPKLSRPYITVYTKTTVPGTTTGYTLTAGSDTLATLNGTDLSPQVGVTLYTRGTTETTASLPYAHWNFWTGNLNKNNVYDNTADGRLQKGYVYAGLVKDKLVNGQIQFNVLEGGIFDVNDTSTKTVYTGVGLPFVYDETTGFYTFNASQDGAYFTGTPASDTNLTWNDTPQYKQAGYGSAGYGFYPFNEGTNFAESAIQYHFGMIATVPFSMTTDGKVSSTNQTDITFKFAGDDDVWVFIDGVLVLDLGGIHDSASGTINFGQNTTSVGATDTSINSGKFTWGVDDSSTLGTITGKLFNDDEGTGLLNTDLATFAATESHTLTVYYLERGKGASNNMLKFNLPVKDTLSVRKTVSSKDSEGAELDASTLAQINARDFGFTLYKNGDPVANATYSLYDINNQYIGSASTNASGHFILRNGQTAKFTGDIGSNTTYLLKEDSLGDTWNDPTYSYTTLVGGAGGTSGSGNENTVTVSGTANEDSVAFTCTNVLKHVDGTTLEANDDYIVIDFGLPVVIDPLANDVVVGGTTSIVADSVTGAQYGTAKIEDGKITYQLTKQLTGVEVLTYTVKATANGGVESDNKEKTANIYIIPATSMYYEEDFGGLVTFSDGWTSTGTAQTDPQEPGVVGTVGDSPYGSDAAYLNDGGDSNGTSKYVNTTDGAASFSYTFTGTGTSFFARTNNNSGYMRVVITDEDGKTVSTLFRDTSYKTEDNSTTLYNIPVFTKTDLNYGTYTVTVTIAGGANAQNYGRKFWLDGIRVMNPLDSTDANASVAQSAYATDGEANMTVVTLREKLINEAQINEDDTISWNAGDNFVLFTDTNGAITSAEEYRSNGPKEEVYLNNGQSVTFSLTDWDPNTNKIYLGIKAPTGSGTVSINGNTLKIENATDCYYDISSYGTITTDENGVKTVTFKIEATSSLISVTNIKVTGNAEFTIVNSPTKNVGGSVGSDENNEDIIGD